MRTRHDEDNLRRPKEYVKSLIKDWKTRGLYTREDIESNREQYLT
jgi:DNA replication protein DnaD